MLIPFKPSPYLWIMSAPKTQPSRFIELFAINQIESNKRLIIASGGGGALLLSFASWWYLNCTGTRIEGPNCCCPYKSMFANQLEINKRSSRESESREEVVKDEKKGEHRPPLLRNKFRLHYHTLCLLCFPSLCYLPAYVGSVQCIPDRTR